MAGEWTETPLSEIVQNFDSRRVPLSSREREKHRGKYPYYGATGVMDHVDDFLFEGLHLLVAEDGSVERPDGKPFLQLVDGRFWVNNHAHVLKAATDDDTKFLYYALSTVPIRPYMSGSVQAKLSQGNLNRIPTPYPRDEADRRAIAHILGTLDDKIELNRRMSKTLEAMARAIFRAWFVDFEPVKAKAEGATSFPSMPQPVFDTLPTRFVDSEIGPVPEGWGVGAVGGLASFSRTQVNPRDYPDELFDHFSIPAFDAGMCASVEPGRAIKSGKFGIVEGCVLLSKLNPRIPRIWLPPLPNGLRQIASTEFLVFIPSSPLDRHYLYCQFRQADFREYLAQGASGTSNSHQRVRPNELLERAVITPPKSIREEFAEIIDPLFDLVAKNHLESANLAELRDYLLPKLLSGEVRVKDAERLMEATS